MSEPRTALIVDDEDQLLRLMARVIERSGMRALTAATAVDARALFAANGDGIDVVLLDVTMPDGEGAAVLMPEFKGANPALDVIVTSGDALSDELEIEMQKAEGRFLRKPFVPKSLLRILAESPSLVSAQSDASGGD